MHAARPGSRRRAAGARHQLVLVDRVMATLIHLRHALLELPCGINRSTITRAVQEIHTLLAEHGHAVPNRTDLRHRGSHPGRSPAAFTSVRTCLSLIRRELLRPVNLVIRSEDFKSNETVVML
ncbi:hypothetical protein GCM10022206_48570 [Streptomyces chiangmaiensis]